MHRIILFTIMSVTASAQTEVDFKPERIQRSSTIVVNAPVDKAFPLFGPLLEMEWAKGWEPRLIFIEQKFVEEHMIFTTKSHYEEDYLWIVTQYRPEQYMIEYTVSTPNRIWFITVACFAQQNSTTVTVTYTYTGLNEKGNEQNKEALQKMFAHDLKDWEKAINYYLETGKQLH